MKLETVETILFAFKKGMDETRRLVQNDLSIKEAILNDHSLLTKKLHEQIESFTELEKNFVTLKAKLIGIKFDRSVTLENQITELDNALKDADANHPRTAALKCAFYSLEMLNEICDGLS